ncbi:MAG TPA: kelch repeat-containing protein [Bacteroidia bacterium]|jgi:N-acetylneuraminic acid mutarotase
MKKSWFILLLLRCAILTGAQGTWSSIPDFGGTSRYGCVATQSGNKGYMGLGYDGNYRDDWWCYDPLTNTWTQKANFAGGARHSAIAFAINNKIYAGLGLTETIFSDLWEYDPAANTWTRKADMAGGARYAATAATSGNKAYAGLGVVGGNGPFFNDWWEYDPAADTWTRKADCPAQARSGASSFTINSAVYVCAGSDVTTNSYFNDLWKYDPLSNSWSAKAPAPVQPRAGGMGFSINGSGYFGLGKNFSSGVHYHDLWKYDANANGWIQQTDFPGSARWAAAVFVIGNSAYAGTGNANNAYTNDMYRWCAKPGKPVAVFGPTSICSGTTDVFTCSPVAGAVSYTWTLPGGWSGNSATNSISATAGSAGGVLTVCANSECGSGPLQYFTVSVDPAPPTPTITQNAATLFSSPATGYQWYLDNNVITGAIAQSYTPALNGNYSVEITGNNGCTAMSDPYPFNSVGVKETGNEDLLSVFPNPGNGIFTLQFSYAQTGNDLFVYDELGEIVFHKAADKGPGETQAIDLSSSPKGIYLLEIRNDNGKYLRKIIVE